MWVCSEREFVSVFLFLSRLGNSYQIHPLLLTNTNAKPNATINLNPNIKTNRHNPTLSKIHPRDDRSKV